MPATPSPRDTYATVAIWLHWTLAMLIVVNVFLWFGHELVARPAMMQMMWFHKSIGLSVLLLALVRLGWRLTHKIPALPDHMPAWERWTARKSHGQLFLLL